MTLLKSLAKRFGSRSFARQAWFYIVGLLICTIVIYSIMLGEFFSTGIDFMIAHDLRSIAAQYDRQNNLESPESVIEGRGIVVVEDYERLPEEIRLAFHGDSLKPLKLYEEELESPSSDFLDPNEDFAFLISFPRKNGQVLYVARVIGTEDLAAEEELLFDRISLYILAPGTAFLLLGALAAHLLNRRLSAPTLALTNWAQTLEIEGTAGVGHPDFNFTELNSIADRLSNEAARLSNLLQREQAFLRYASHELRTPIAVTRGTLELLYKRELPAEINDKLDRLARANRGMQDLVETLLWLSREAEPELDSVPTDIVAIVRSTLEDHAYLLRDNSVSISTSFEHEQVIVQSAPVPTKIVLANLVRNAFQHTVDGEVGITVTRRALTIQSVERDGVVVPDSLTGSDGIGISLVRRIADRMGWDLTLDVEHNTVTWRWVFRT